MSNDLILNPDSLPAHLRAQASAGNAWDSVAVGGSVPRIEVRAEYTKAVIGDQVIAETEDPITIVIVKPSPVQRTFYRATYDPSATATAPDCYSHDGVTPSKNAQDPQCHNCADCPQNVKGSSTVKADSRACRHKQTLAVLLPGRDELFRLTLPSTAIFPAEPTRSGHMALNPYVKTLRASHVTPDMLLTEVKRDLSLGNIRPVFKAVSWIDEAMQAKVLAALEDPEMDNVLGILESQNYDATAKREAASAALGIPAPSAPALPAPTAPAEPAKRTKRVAKASSYNYTPCVEGDRDDDQTFWVDASDVAFTVPAGTVLPDYELYQEVGQSSYSSFLVGAPEDPAAEVEAAKARVEAEAAEKAAKAAAEKAAAEKAAADKAKAAELLAAAQAKAAAEAAPAPKPRRSKPAPADGDKYAVKKGTEYMKDPEEYTDEADTYWQHKENDQVIFFVPAEAVLPCPDTYTEIDKATAEQLRKAQVDAAEKAAAAAAPAEAKPRRRKAADTETTTEATPPRRRSHNAKPQTAPEDEAPRVVTKAAPATTSFLDAIRGLG